MIEIPIGVFVVMFTIGMIVSAIFFGQVLMILWKHK